MKNYIKILFFIIATLLFLACKKDKLYPSPSTDNETVWVDTLKCEEYTSDSIQILSHGWGRYQYRTPYYNPINSNEFIYSYYDYEINTQQLVKYNIVTKQKLVLANYGIYNQPKWNKNGWITFSNMHHVHVVKDDGSNYRQITSETMNTHPFWNEDDLYWSYSPSGGTGGELRQSMSQLVPDTIGRSILVSDIRNNKVLTVSNIEISAAPPTYYGIYDLDKSQNFNIENFDVLIECSKAITGLAWDPSGDFFYSTMGYQGNNGNGGLYKITLTGQEEKIMDFCQSKQYSNISCSSDGRYLIGERTACSLVKLDSWSGAARIVQNSTIWLINTETMEETKINLE